MYDVGQTLQILIHTSQLCLEKDVDALHKKHPIMLEANIIEHVVKYKILEKMVGSSKWHCAQLFHMTGYIWSSSFISCKFLR
jgi:hypothetical protein